MSTSFSPLAGRKVYIAGPMRGIPEFNFPAFDHAADVLERLGAVVFSPAQRDRDEDGFDPKGLTGHEDLSLLGFDLRHALAEDVAYVAREADLVVLLDGWDDSSGALAEASVAIAVGVPMVRFRVIEALAETFGL